jgi:hypothetical protein
MQLSIKDASRFVIGAAILREMAATQAPDSGITFDQVAEAAAAPSIDGQDLRLSLERLAQQEGAWFRNTPPHTLTSVRVMQTRAQEADTLNQINLAVLGTLAHGTDAVAGDHVAQQLLQDHYQGAIGALDRLPGSVTERRQLLNSLKTQVAEASGDAPLVGALFGAAQKAYLEQLMADRLAAYQSPALERSKELELGA